VSVVGSSEKALTVNEMADSAMRISIAKAARVFLGKALKCCSDEERQWLEAKVAVENEREK
jgi:hypothetical protein